MPGQNSSERTKILLAKSLRELMKKKPLDKITIREIVEGCNVNRQTFYYHFQDIYALVEWIYRYDTKVLLSSSSSTDDWSAMIKKIIDYAAENREEILCVLNSRANVYFGNFVYESVYSGLRYAIDKVDEENKIDDYYKEFITNFYSMGVCGIADEWVRNNNSTRMSSSELLHMFKITMQDSIYAAIERCEKMSSGERTDI